MIRRHFDPALFLISFLTLYLQLVLIRWIPSQSPIFAWLTNVTLMAAVLGLGVGCLVPDRKRIFNRLFAPLLAALMILASSYREMHFGLPDSITESLWIGSGRGTLREYISFFARFFLLWITVAIVHVPVGMRLGAEFRKRPPLQAYTINLVGALVAIAAITAIAFAQASPLAWFVPIFVATLLLVERRTSAILVVLFSSAFGLGAIAADSLSNFWSPYSRISVQASSDPNRPATYYVWVNSGLHQQMMDLSDSATKSGHLAYERAIYDLPYRSAKPRNVLIVGGGSGNDAAAALRAGVDSVDVVEIDPVFLELGRAMHPESPYLDDRVNLINMDARHYFHRTNRRYDLVVFGFLDSVSSASAVGRLRLDNYLYTEESFREAARLLNSTGTMALSFYVNADWVGSHLHQIARIASGQEPTVVRMRHGHVFITTDTDLGAAVARGDSDLARVGATLVEYPVVSNVPTDDWPFLYMKNRHVPRFYLLVLAGILLISTVVIFSLVRVSGRGTGRRMFFLGAGFLLLETRGFAMLALVIGASWLTNALIIGGILLMVLAANLIVAARRAPSEPVVWTALAAAVLAATLVTPNFFLEMPTLVGAALAIVCYTLPLFFAGIIFSREIESARRPEAAYGLNLLGALLGGALEYSSLSLGFGALGYVALALYCLAAASISRGVRASTAA